MQNHWFDAHLDLACLAVNRRDMTSDDLTTCGGPWLPASVTLPALKEGGVVACLGTIFTELGGDGPEGYPGGNAEAAHKRGRAQLEVYRDWEERGLISLGLREALRQVDGANLAMGILVECADPIRTPDELAWWVEAGVIAVGMSWGNGSRYSGGNAQPGVGISDMGRDFVAAMDALGVIHDLSHLSQRSTDDLLALTDRPVMASHSNVRALVEPANERHLADETIIEIGARNGMVGVNLVSNFVDPDVTQDPPTRARLPILLDHIERICELMGRRDGVGLGSDMDGGFSAEWLPQGIDTPSDLHRITDGLRDRGWSDEEVEGFRFGNWARFIADHSPEHGVWSDCAIV